MKFSGVNKCLQWPQRRGFVVWGLWDEHVLDDFVNSIFLGFICMQTLAVFVCEGVPQERFICLAKSKGHVAKQLKIARHVM